MTHYIVVSENEIVKAEMKTESNHWKKCDCLMCIALKQDLASLPRIAIQGKHKWEVWQEVPESEIRWQYQYCKPDNIFRWFNCERNDHIGWPKYLCRIVAIPIQPTPEGEKVEEDYRKSIEGNYVFDRNKWQATYAGDILLIHKK